MEKAVHGKNSRYIKFDPKKLWKILIALSRKMRYVINIDIVIAIDMHIVIYSDIVIDIRYDIFLDIVFRFAWYV